MISSELRYLSTAVSDVASTALEQGTFVEMAPHLIPLQMQMIYWAQRELVTFLLSVETDWPWAKQATTQ